MPNRHVLTGDLNIVTNNQLRSLLYKGLNYRDQQPPNKIKTYDATQEGIDTYTNTIIKKQPYTQ